MCYLATCGMFVIRLSFFYCFSFPSLEPEIVALAGIGNIYQLPASKQVSCRLLCQYSCFTVSEVLHSQHICAEVIKFDLLYLYVH